ncbi:MAG: hypothetical protein HC856_07165 [Pseudanabaena sp. RU_4_16]|nr:hypothetical protein [Pseudanabaena sp. RU_4_16]
MSNRTMPEPQASQSIGSLQVELSSELYDALMAKVRSSGCSTNELVQQGLRLYLGLETNDRTKERTEDSRSTVEQTIESRLSELESRIMERVCLEIEARMASIKLQLIPLIPLIFH